MMCQQKGNVSNFTLLPLTLADSETLSLLAYVIWLLATALTQKNNPKNTFRCLTE